MQAYAELLIFTAVSGSHTGEWLISAILDAFHRAQTGNEKCYLLAGTPGEAEVKIPEFFRAKNENLDQDF